MEDRTEMVRSSVERYEGFEFIALRVQDAFDPAWWLKTTGAQMPASLSVDLTNEGALTTGKLLAQCLIPYAHRSSTFVIFFRISPFTPVIPADLSSLAAHSDRYPDIYIYPRSRPPVLYRQIDRIFTSRSRHIPHIAVYCSHIINFPRRRFRRAAGVVRRVESSKNSASRHICAVGDGKKEEEGMERGGPGRTTVARDWDEGVRSLGMVERAPSSWKRETTRY